MIFLKNKKKELIDRITQLMIGFKLSHKKICPNVESQKGYNFK
jgi:hypothetical protein